MRRMGERVPTIGTFIPTQGRDTLRITTASIIAQGLLPGDDVLIVGDGSVPSARKLCEELGPPFRYLEGPRTGDYGHSQCNCALSYLKTDLLVMQGDDDVFAVGAFQRIRETALRKPKQLLGFKFDSRDGMLPNEFGTWDGHCVVVPNISHMIGRFGPYHDGDQQYLNMLFNLWGGKPEVEDFVLSAAERKNATQSYQDIYDEIVRYHGYGRCVHPNCWTDLPQGDPAQHPATTPCSGG